jgi:small-conductance mechanosensitive channel
VRSFEPIVRLHSFGESAVLFQIVIQVNEYDVQFDASGEIHTRILERLNREGITVPFPTRTLHIEGRLEEAAAPSPKRPSGATKRSS